MVPREVIVGYNASGAATAAKNGYVVMIVDIIDMSTSLEAALEGGAFFVFGASPDITKAPVKVDPARIGFIAGDMAKKLNTQIVIITEPRWGKKSQRIANCRKVVEGINKAGGNIVDFIPNLGAEIGKIISFRDRIVICVSDTGGVAYDAAYQYHDRVVTGTIARTMGQRVNRSTQIAVQRVVEVAKGDNIAVIAASSNSVEDILAANYICQQIISTGYLTNKLL